MAQATHIQYGNSHCGNIIGSFNTVYKSDEDAQIMRWLSPLEPNNRHQGVRNDRFEGVGGWFLETGEFRGWKGGQGGVGKAVLFCSGNPGVGKTYLSSLVIDSLCDEAKAEGIAVAGLYCDFLAQREQTVTNMMGAILKQLVGRGGIPIYLREAFQEGKRDFGGRGLRLADLMGMLRIAIASLPQVFICIDALDECVPKHLPELLKSLREIVREFPRTRIFLTGRPHVGEDINRYFPQAVVIPTSPKVDEIRDYLQMRLNKDTEPKAMNDDLRADIVRIILDKMSNIFLLASLNIDAILGEVTIRQRRKKLEEMAQGNGLSDAYTATLRRLQAQKGNKPVLGLRALMWVLYSERPLRAEELCHALGVEIGSEDQDLENIPALQTLLASCLGLLTVEASSSTVRLVHFTLQEHLLRDPTLFHSPHSTIAEVCLTYLNFVYVWDLSPALYSAPSRAPLLEYASFYWGKHIRGGVTENVKMLALRLLERFDKHISAQLLLLRYNEDRGSGPCFDRAGGPAGFTGLHGVAFLGITEMVAAVLEMKEWDVNAADCMGSTALAWAARRGYEEVVKTLLERGDVNPDKAHTKSGRTPLSLAAESGHGGVVKMLLEREDVNPDQADTKCGRTPLSWAAGCGHKGVVGVLLERDDIDPNAVDSTYGGTPLSWAAWSGRIGVVKILLEREGVNLDQADSKYGRTPLSWAAECGHEGVVGVLLERDDIDPNAVDSTYGGTPLSWAAWRGRIGAVKMLLAREGINPDQADTKSGRTPLSWAAEYGHEEIVKVLLECEDVNPNQAYTEDGRTPLSRAAEKGHEGVVKMLLERDDVDPNSVEKTYGRTPLSWAAWRGQTGVVKMLLAREGVNPDQADTNSGRTPLSWVAEGGHEGIVEMLLESENVNPDQADTESGRTPLSWAAKRGHEGIVKMLLKRADFNPDQAITEYGQTPLLWAAKNGYQETVRTLLEREGVNPNTADNKYGQTPLTRAAWHGHKGVVKMLLEQEDVNPNTADRKHGRTPLAWAAWRGHIGIVKMLLERKDVLTATPDNNHQTPLSLALSKRRDRVVKLLSERGNINSDASDSTRHTSLPLSARHED